MAKAKTKAITPLKIGISIFSNGSLIEGNKGLAGEAKYLPYLMDKSAPVTETELAANLSEMTAIYNAVIAPSIFVISSENADEELMRKAIETNTYLLKQPSKPRTYFDQDFQKSMTVGLRWLVTQDTIYRMQ